MAVVREELILVDRFTNAFNQYIQIAERAARTSRDMRDSLLNIETATAATAKLIQELTEQVRRLADQLGNGGRQGQNFGGSMQSVFSGLTGVLGRVLSLYTAIRGVKWAVGMSDELAGVNARLKLMTEEYQTVAQLQDMIYASAVRSRGSYTETANFVSQLGLLAGNAFNSNAELIAFSEVLNKQLAISGQAGTAAANGAMIQLQQALAAGVLRGQELNSVMLGLPNVAQAIAEYMGVGTAEMRAMAAEGRVTADIVKNALLASAEETNEQFAAMPRTWGQVMNQLKNEAVQALEPLFDALSQLANSTLVDDIIDGVASALRMVGRAAQFAADHAEGLEEIMDTMAPSLRIAAAMLGAYAVYSVAASVGQHLLNAAMNANPIGIIIALIVGLLLVLAKLWDESEGFRNFVLESIERQAEACSWFYNSIIVPIYNGVAPVLNALGNAFLDLAEIVVRAFSSAARSLSTNVDNMMGVLGNALDLHNAVAGALGGTIISARYSFTPDGIEDAEKDAMDAINRMRGRSLPESIRPIDVEAMREALGDWKATADKFRFSDLLGGNNPEDIVRRLLEVGLAGGDGGGFVPYDELMDLLNGINESVKDAGKTAARAVDMTQEDLKELIDVAERRYVNRVNLTSQTPVITVNGANTGRTAADRQSLADAIRDILIEQTSSGAVRTTARTF